ncbi:hypothetical protein LXL04_001522 [Taraxacum kok-saghyz]
MWKRTRCDFMALEFKSGDFGCGRGEVVDPVKVLIYNLTREAMKLKFPILSPTNLHVDINDEEKGRQFSQLYVPSSEDGCCHCYGLQSKCSRICVSTSRFFCQFNVRFPFYFPDCCRLTIFFSSEKAKSSFPAPSRWTESRIGSAKVFGNTSPSSCHLQLRIGIPAFPIAIQRAFGSSTNCDWVRTVPVRRSWAYQRIM